MAPPPPMQCREWKGKNAYSHLILSYSHYFLGMKKCLIRTIFHCLIALFFIPIRTIFSAIKETKFTLFALFHQKKCE